MTGAPGQLPQVAGGVIVNPLGTLAVVSQLGTSWSLPKGHLNPGESSIDAARREAAEETGLTSLVHQGELCSYERSALDAEGRPDDTRWKRITLHLFTTPALPLAPQDPCNPEARWAAPQEAAGLLTHPEDRQALTRVLPRVRAAAEQARAASDAAALQRVRAQLPGIPESVVSDFMSLADADAAELEARAEWHLEKPYGANHILVGTGRWGLSFARLLPGRSSSFHLHRTRREFFRVRTGVLTLRTGAHTAPLYALECGESTPDVPHAIANDGAEPLEIVEIFSPAALDDKVRIEDRYGRPLGQVVFGE
ncbi:NUDIX domain-containing protein [Streptomyces sp. NPDC004647]|uniref:NUDIX domain-containing protein n=1 Tax=Streptomyces sp. NPDC004647 TaxID=3154671 RepID=UPI0033BD8A8D